MAELPINSRSAPGGKRLKAEGDAISLDRGEWQPRQPIIGHTASQCLGRGACRPIGTKVASGEAGRNLWKGPASGNREIGAGMGSSGHKQSASAGYTVAAAKSAEKPPGAPAGSPMT